MNIKDMVTKMSRYVFYSFHYEKDIWRVFEVRNHWVTKGSFLDAGIVDAAEFEKVKLKGDRAIKQWIDEQLNGTSVTVVLIGEDTLNRPYVQYEIEQSYLRGNGLVGVHIDWLKDQHGDYCGKGSTRLKIGSDYLGRPIYFEDVAKIYCYKNDDGYNNLEKWVEEAAENAGR